MRSVRASLIALVALGPFGCGSHPQRLPPAMPVASEVRVFASDPNLSSAEVENEITVPIESALRTLPGVLHVRSVSRPGESGVACVFGPATDPSMARSRVLNHLPRGLPEGVVATLGTDAHSETPPLRFTVESPTASADERTRFVRETIRPALLRIPGVIDVLSCGAREREVRVDLDLARMTAFRITLREVDAALRAQRIAVADAVDAIAAVTIRSSPVPIAVRDIAQVGYGIAPPRCIAIHDGSADGVDNVVHFRVGDDPARVAANVRQAVASLAGRFAIRWFEANGGVFRAEVFLPPEITLGDAERIAVEIDSTLHTLPEVATSLLEVGSIDGDPFGAAVDRMQLRVGLQRGIDASAEVLATIRTALMQRIPGIEVAPDESHAVRIEGSDLDLDRRAAEEIRQVLASTPGVLGAVVQTRGSIARRIVHPDRAQLARVGLDASDVTDVVRLASATGIEVARIGSAELPTPVVLRAAGMQSDRGAFERLLQLPIPGSVSVPVEVVADVHTAFEPGEITRFDGTRYVEVRYWGPTGSAFSVVASAMRSIATSVRLAPGIRLAWER